MLSAAADGGQLGLRLAIVGVAERPAVSFEGMYVEWFPCAIRDALGPAREAWPAVQDGGAGMMGQGMMRGGMGGHQFKARRGMNMRGMMHAGMGPGGMMPGNGMMRLSLIHI